jgi:transposase InsO family protein
VDLSITTLSGMPCSIAIIINLLLTLGKILRPGGWKKIVAENLMLKHQLTIMARSHKKAPNLQRSDRIYLGFLSMLIPRQRLAAVAVAVQPASLLKFHRALVNRKYQVLYGNRGGKQPGPKGPSQALIQAIVEIKERNPRFGYPRIAQMITAQFGIEINKDVVRRVLAKHYRPGPGTGPSWLTFLGHSKDSLWSVDLFRCESLRLRSHWVLVVMDHYTRRIVGFGVHAGDVDGIALCCMFNQAISGADPPRYVSSDNDPLFRFHRWQANLRVLEITEIKTVPFTPVSHPFVERLIGTIRREFLDHTPFWNSLDLQRKLAGFRDYYNNHRTHTALSGQSPATPRKSEQSSFLDINDFAWESHCGGMFQTPVSA